MYKKSFMIYSMFKRITGFSMSDNSNPKDLIGETKTPLWLVPAALKIYVAQVFKGSLQKYGLYNWRDKAVKLSVYLSAMDRHLTAFTDGEDIAEDTGLPHLAHLAANCGIILDVMATGNLIDDRPAKGPAAALLKAFTERRE